MPEKEEIAKGVLRDYINVSRNNPGGLTDQQFISKLPSIQTAGLGGDAPNVIAGLREFETKLNQLPSDQVESFTQNFISSFGTPSGEKPVLVQNTNPTDTKAQPSQESKQIIKGYLEEIRNNPGGVTNDFIQNQLISKAGLSADAVEVSNSLKQFNADLNTKSKDEIGDFINTYTSELDGLLKKKEETIQLDESQEPSIPSQSQEQPLASVSDGSISELGLEEVPTDFIPPIQSREEAISQFTTSAQKLDETFEQRLEGKDEAAKNLESQISVVDKDVREDLAAQMNISDQELDQRIGNWALNNSVVDPSGEALSEKDKEARIILRNRYALNEINDLAQKQKAKLFNQALSLTGGDEAKANELFRKKANEVGFNHLSEDDLSIKKVQDEIFQLRDLPERNIDEDIKLKSLEKQYSEIIDDGFTGDDLYDPTTGKFISGNKKKEVSQEVKNFNNLISEKTVQYQDTDVESLRKIRDDFYLKFLAFNDQSKSTLEDIEQRKFELRDATIGSRDELIALDEKEDAYNNRSQEFLADFMAVNKMLLLNQDPGNIEDVGFFGSITQGFKESIGDVPVSESALADRAINALKNEGFEITPEQRDKLNKTLTQKVGRTVGQSIPISAEIGLNLFVGNKVAGALKIPKLAQAIAGTNKLKQFGLTMLYESALQGTAFAVSGESFSSGVGEGVGQVIGSSLLSRFGVKNKILNFATRAVTGATTETMAEFSGQFLEELTENGYDVQKATEETFGKTADEAIEKLAITYFTALTMGMGGAGQQSQLFLEQAQQKIQASDSDSPIVDAAKEIDVTSEVSNEETVELETLREKINNGEELNEEETFRSEFLESKKEFSETKESSAQEEQSPVILVNESKETEYKFKEGDQKGFINEQEIVDKLDDANFIEKVKTGEVQLDIVNPSQEVEAKVKEVFPENPEVEAFVSESTAEPEIQEGGVITPEEVVPTAETSQITAEAGQTNIEPEIGVTIEAGQTTEVEPTVDPTQSGQEPIIEPVVEKKQKIKEAADKLAENILKAKISLSKYESLSANPVGGIIEAAVNSSVFAASEVVRAGGTVAQAVSDGVTNLKQTDWYKSLSEEGKVKAESLITNDIEVIITDSEKVIKTADTPKNKPSISKSKTSENISEKKVAGDQKLNKKNKIFAERLDKQSDLSKETREAIVAESPNIVRNQKTLVKGTKKAFDQVMSETNGNYREVIRLADNPSIDPDVREFLYANVMQHLSVLEKNADPSISKAASNDLVSLGIITAERLNQAGKQIKAMGTIYANFPMYVFYSSLARIEKFTNKQNDKKGKANLGDIKNEGTQGILDVIDEIEQNIDQLLKDPAIAKKLSKIKGKIEAKRTRPTSLSSKRKSELQKKKKDAINKFFGRTGKVQAGIPGAEQVVAMLEYAAILIEEGFYRTKDIINEIKDVLNSRGAKLSDVKIRSTLNRLREFREISESESETTKKDSFGDIMSKAVGKYLRAGVEFSNLTLDQALIASDKAKEGFKKELINQLTVDFNLTNSEGATVVELIDQIFRDKAVEKLKKGFNKFYAPLSMRKVGLDTKAEKLSKDASLGAFDTTMEFMNMTFQKYGMINNNDQALIQKIKDLSDKVRNTPDGVLKDRHVKNLETEIHKVSGGYGFPDWIMTRFYGSILSGPLTHAKNMSYNTFAIGVFGPISQIYTAKANPISTIREMIRSFYKVDARVASHYWRTGNNFVDPAITPKTYADQLQFNLIKNGFTKLLNLASTRTLVASDLIMTRPFESAVFRNHIKSWIKETQGLKGRALENKAAEMLGYTQSNVDKSSKEAKQDVIEDYGFDPFTGDITGSVNREATTLLLLRTQERILKNSGIQEKIGSEGWFDVWNGESLAESSKSESKTLALQGEVNGFVGLVSDRLEKLIDSAPALKFKVPFIRILGNMTNMAIKWTPGLGQLQAISRYTVNKSLAKKGMPTTSSFTIWAAQKIGDVRITKKRGLRFFKEGVLEKFNKNQSLRQSSRDLKNSFFAVGVHALIYTLLAKDEDDEGLVVTGLLDKSFFKRGSITSGTGAEPFSIYWRNEDGSHDLITEYKNSAYGFAFSFWGSLADQKSTGEDDQTTLYLKSLLGAPFYIAEKPAATALKELFDQMSPTDKYGRNKWLDDIGYKDQSTIGVSQFINSVFVPNLFKQSNKIGEQIYGVNAKRATNWWEALIKGMPFANQVGLEAQVDHFGRPIEQKTNMGFLGVKGNKKQGFTMLDPEKIDPYYEIYTDHDKTPKWFTDKEVPVYQKKKIGEFEIWEKAKLDQPGGVVETAKIRISKYEGHILNALIGEFRKEAIDNYIHPTIVDGDVKIEKGLSGFESMNNAEFNSASRSIESEAKEKAFISFFENYYGDDVKFSNQKNDGGFVKIK